MSGSKNTIEYHSLLFRVFPRLSVSGKQKPWISEDERPPPAELSDLHEEINFDSVSRSSQLRRVMTMVLSLVGTRVVERGRPGCHLSRSS